MSLFTIAEREKLVELLLQLGNIINPDTRQALIGSLPLALQQSVPLSSNYRNDIRLLVDVVEGKGAQLDDGSWPIELVMRRAIKDTDGLQLAVDLKAMLDTALSRAPAAHAAPIAPAAPLDLYKTCMLLDEKPFVNRVTFRGHMKAMVKSGASALIVEGSTYTGKSYSYQFIRYLWQEGVIPPPVFVNVGNIPRNSVAAKMVVASLARLSGENADELLTQYDINSIDRWIVDVGDWLTTRANERAMTNGNKWWIVLDNIAPRLQPGQSDPAPDVTELLNRLVKQMVARCYDTIHLRVVVLGYKETELAMLEQSVVDEVRVDRLPDTIDPLELETFLRDHFQFQGQAERLADVPAMLGELEKAVPDRDIRTVAKLWKVMPTFFRSRVL